MIVVTTPTGQVGSQLVTRLLSDGVPLRAIVRDPAKLGPEVRDAVEVIEGSHDNPVVLDRALSGADALFWLVPPDPQASSAQAHYLAFARAGAEAIRYHGVGHVVGITSAGHGWPKPAGLLSAAFAMDTELAASGAAYRGLSMPFYMDNLLRHLDTIREQGVFSLTCAPNQPLAMVATADIAAVAAALLTDLTWASQAMVPVFGPDRLTPNQMAEVMADVFGRPVAYQQAGIDDFAAAMTHRGWREQAIRDMTEMNIAQLEGIYDADWATATPTTTDFRSWLEHATRATGKA